MNAFARHFSFEFRTGVREKEQLLMNYLFPLGVYVLLGMLMSQLNPVFRETAIPAMIIIAIMASTLLGLPNPLVSSREAGIFRSYKINGVPALSILTIPALTTLLHVVVVAIVITATAPLLLSASLPGNWLAFILLFLLGAFAHAGLGMLISVVSSNTRALVLWSQLVFLPSMMLGGLMIPFDMLPDLLGRIALLLPATHTMNALSQLAWGQAAGFDALWSIIILAAGGVLSLGLAIYLFCWDRYSAIRRGHPALAVFAAIPYVLAVIFF